VTRPAFVQSLPDLIGPAEYSAYPEGGLVRMRITVTQAGVEVLADGLRPEQVEAVLESLVSAEDEGTEMEQMLCG
jgi:FtsH ternary system-associated peptide